MAPAQDSNEHGERLAREVSDHAARDALGALALDVLSRQAEGKQLFAGREFVDRRAAEHGVERAAAETGAGNLLVVLERGPESEHERRTVVAFALHGLSRRLEEDEAAASRFARHAEWLELATPYEVLGVLDAQMPSGAELVHRELAQGVVEERGEAPAVRARNALRLSALARSERGRGALATIVSARGVDEPTRALARALGGASADGEPERIRGRGAWPAPRGALATLRWITGWAIIAWLARGIATLAGARRETELVLGERDVEVREERWVLGRKVGERRSSVALSSLVSAARDVRFPSLHLMIGAAALTGGLLAGGLLIFDGTRSGELTLALLGAGLALGGVLLDLALDVLVPGARGRVRLELAAHRGRVVAIADVPLEAADRFLGALRARTR